MSYNPGVAAKAIIAALTAGQAALVVALQDGDLSTFEIVAIAVATGVAGLTVYSTPNSAPTDLPLAEVDATP